jgi:cysteinyl-tRNA synthetase
MRRRITLALVLGLVGCHASGRNQGSKDMAAPTGREDMRGSGGTGGTGGNGGNGGNGGSGGNFDLAGVPSTRGFPVLAPWVSFYGDAAQMGDLNMVASTFRIINIDLDPDQGNFTTQQVAQLKSGGKNRVISYLNIGSCETFRSYWSTAPNGLVSCSANTAAKIGPYNGYPDETWMNPANTDYQNLMLWAASRLVAQGADGFFLDNLEIVEHGTGTSDGPCDATCAQGGLDFVGRLRAQNPGMLIVMQNGTSTVTMNGMTTSGIPYPSLLDGISHEEVNFPSADPTARGQLDAWRKLGLFPGGHPFFIGTEDYVGDCSDMTDAKSAYWISADAGFSPYASDQSSGQKVVCYWSF